MLNLFDFNLISIFHFISFDRILTTSRVFFAFIAEHAGIFRKFNQQVSRPANAEKKTV